MDYNLLATVANALNFTISILPSNNWKEVSFLDILPKMQLINFIVLISPLLNFFYSFTKLLFSLIVFLFVELSCLSVVIAGILLVRLVESP